jgi:Predicted redox protein, regulator of disulfide bond formation
MEDIEKAGCAVVNIGGRSFRIKKQFIDDLRAQNHVEIIKNLKKAILVMHSPQDRVVEIDNAANIYGLAKHPKSFITLDGADHLLTAKDDAYYAGQVIASWVKRYVNFPERQPLSTDQQVVVRLDSQDKYTSDIQASRHGLVADEPEEVGGNDFGASPYELLNASLGSCTAMTLHMYARRKGWDLKEVKVHLNHRKTTFHHEDIETPGEADSKIDKFEKIIELSGDLDREQRERLLEIANKCPIHRTLASPQVFASRLMEDEDWKVSQGR